MRASNKCGPATRCKSCDTGYRLVEHACIANNFVCRCTDGDGLVSPIEFQAWGSYNFGDDTMQAINNPQAGDGTARQPAVLEEGAKPKKTRLTKDEQGKSNKARKDELA